MLDPSLPWLAVGYRNFKQDDFCQRSTHRDEANSYRIDTMDGRNVLRSSTPQGQQRRRVKSATAARFTSSSCDSFMRTLAARPKSAQTYANHRGTHLDVNRAKSPVNRQLRPRSAFLPHHRPSSAQNRSVSVVERLHHSEKTIKLSLDEKGSKCAFCPVECRPKSSSSNRPTSSTGLVAAHVPSHYDRYVFWTRPRTAPATRREFLQLPRHNNIRRGHVPHYTNFVKRVELGPRDRTPSPPPRRRRAFEEEPVGRRSPSPELASNADVELLLSGDEVDIDDELEEDVSIRVPTPSEPALDDDDYDRLDETPAEESQEAWAEPKAPTPSPAISGRNSPEPEPSHPSPIQEEPVSEPPPDRAPTPPPREATPPPPREPSPVPPREPSPLPPPREPTPPPRDPTPPPREPTPPPEPKPKKEVRIQETPLLPPAKPKTTPQVPEKIKSCLAKKPEVPKENKPQPKSSTPEPEEVVEIPAQSNEPTPAEDAPLATEEEGSGDAVEGQDEGAGETQPDETSSGEATTNTPEKKKLGPPPKYKVDLFAVDSQDLLDMEMRMRRKGPDSVMSDNDTASMDIPEHMLRRRPPWQQGRLALSRRACRFEIPMDVYLLETMTPTEYLQKYCIVNKRRQAMYRRSFGKADRDNDMKINMKEFNAAVQEALVDTVHEEQIQDVLKLIEADGFKHFGPKLFCAICSLLERLYYRDFVTEDTVDQESLVAKERVEDADFLALDWKFDGCNVNPPLKRLLYML